MEANQSEVEKLDLTHLPIELRMQLLESMTEMLRTATDPSTSGPSRSVSRT